MRIMNQLGSEGYQPVWRVEAVCHSNVVLPWYNQYIPILFIWLWIKSRFHITMFFWDILYTRPGQRLQFAIENNHRNSWFCHHKWVIFWSYVSCIYMLVGGIPTPLKNMNSSMVGGWHPIYEMENKPNDWNHQADLVICRHQTSFVLLDNMCLCPWHFGISIRWAFPPCLSTGG